MITAINQGISYNPVPKVACTSLKTLFFKIENGIDFIPLVRNGIEYHIHDYYPSRPFNPLDNNLRQKLWNFAVVRDPIERLISCYRNRVVFYGQLSAHNLGPEAIKAGCKPDPDIHQFIDGLENYIQYSAPVRHHLEPHTFFLGSDASYYDDIFQMDEMDKLIKQLSARLATQIVVEHLQTGGPKIDTSELNSKEKQLIRNHYIDDYRVFF